MEVYEPIALPRLHPALTPEQRLHLELHGYVVVQHALTADETGTLLQTVYDIEERVRAGEQLPSPAYVHAGKRTFFRVDNLPHLAPCFLDYLTHPHLWGMAEEALGGEGRLEQSDITIRRPDDASGFGLHRGGYDGMSFYERGLYHYPFVKTLTMLTDVGPDDGGTVVLPGSHKLTGLDAQKVIGVVDEHPELLHQVEAPAGSTVLFYESTVHGSGIIRSGRDRAFIVGGYSQPMYQPWHEYDPDPEWLATLDEPYRIFLSGSNRWLWRPRSRKDLAAPAQTMEEAEGALEAYVERTKAYGEQASAHQRDLGTVDP